jgi:alpha-ribazole phosphatase
MATLSEHVPPIVHAWRHPRARGQDAGWCIGRCDPPVDPRRAKRLAHRIRRHARHSGLPQFVVTSRLERAHAVGRWLRRWGWRHVVDAALDELDFGRWDGRLWSAVPVAEIEAWCADFAQAAPGGDGESVAALLHRVHRFDPGDARVVVTHGGWLSAAAWLAWHKGAWPVSTGWPVPPRHGERTVIEGTVFATWGDAAKGSAPRSLPSARLPG